MSARSTLRRPSIIIPAAIALLVAVVWAVAAVRASQPPTLDQRVKAVASQVQVPGGFGDSAATSSLPVAQEMRDLIRQDLSQGMSDRQILDYFRQRYGDGILETPPANGFNALLWLPAIVLAAIAAYYVWRALRARLAVGPSPAQRARPGNAPASADEDGYRELLRREIVAEEGLKTTREGGRS